MKSIVILLILFIYSSSAQNETYSLDNWYKTEKTDGATATLTTIQVTDSINDIQANITWKDQGWGNRKGRIYMQVIRDGVVLHQVSIFPAAEHHVTSTSATDINCRFDPHEIQAGDSIKLWANIGVGGGHELSINVLRFRIYYGEDTCPSVICPVEDAFTFDWDELTSSGGDSIPHVDVVMDIDKDSLSLIIDATLQYVVKSSADDEDEFNYGTTYVLDFEDFNAHKSSITQPSSCQNRRAIDFVNLNEEERYETTDEFDDIGTPLNMCYPPTDATGWSIDSVSSDCDNIIYRGLFSWNDLRNCKNADGTPQTSVDKTDDDYLRLTGTFYINVISPFWKENNDAIGGFYRVYQLWSQPWEIRISTSVYVIGTTGINVMTMSIISVYKENKDADYTLILLTETAEYMELKNPQFITVPTNPQQFTLVLENLPENNGCLNNKAYICSQLWKIIARDTTCNTDRNDENPNGGIDFSGDYSLRFTPDCRTGNGDGGYDYNTYCLNWLQAHPIYKNDNINDNNVENGVALSSHLTFVDGICDAKTFTVQLHATMNFYQDNSYDDSKYIDPKTSKHLYQVGVDTVYGEIILNFPSDTRMIFDSKLVNVWLCTFPPDTNVAPPNQDGPNIDPAHDATNGGCFSNLRDGFIDGEGDEFFFHVYGEQIAEDDFIVIEDGNEGNDVIHFEFTVPNEIQRDTLYVHAQVEVLLEELGRRRLLLDITTRTTNKIAHFGTNIGITNKNKPKQPEIPQPYHPQQPIQPPPLHFLHVTQPFTISLNSTWVIIVATLLAIILIFNIIFMCYMNCCKSFSKNRRSGYDSVKEVDSEEFDSEANLIDVN